MRATLNIPDELLDDVQSLCGEKSKTRAIVIAMEDYVRRRRMESLIALQGKLTIDYDWEAAEREERLAAEAREKYHGK
ncbi:MAG TPA: type II toxin-antitoxin system VapB family antitoxin [Desulfuromonadales bacterium]|nr:type II toxin-antitoxin system VapB family antitoxin [Desulfuromonadales bacterium]